MQDDRPYIRFSQTPGFEMIANKQSITRALAKIFVDRRGTILDMMADYTPVPEDITNGQAAELYIQLLEENPEFVYRISELAIKDEFSSINGGEYRNAFGGGLSGLFGGGGQAGNGGQSGQAGGTSDSGVTIGADPVSAIAGAIGSIFGFAGSIIDRKSNREQARYDLLNNIIALDRQRQTTDPTQKTLIMVLVGGLGLLGIILLMGGKKS